MVNSREHGGGDADFKAEKPKRGITVIKKPLDIKLEDFTEVPKEALEKNPEMTPEKTGKQPIEEWAEDLRAIAKLKKTEKLSEVEKARDELKKLFKE